MCGCVCLFRLSEPALKALAHRNDEEEADSARRSKRAKACADAVAIKAARMRQGLLVLMVRTPAHNLAACTERHDGRLMLLCSLTAVAVLV